MDRKAQGLSLNVIIVAAIGLLVLVILSVIFIGKMGGTSRDIDRCETKGGSCVVSTGDSAADCPTGIAPGSWKCLTNDGEVDEAQVCCRPNI